MAEGSKKITKDMTLGDAIQKYPQTAMIMMKHGLHCVGCHVAAWETIEQGSMGHGMSEEGMNKMIEEMNKTVDKKPKKKKKASS